MPHYGPAGQDGVRHKVPETAAIGHTTPGAIGRQAWHSVSSTRRGKAGPRVQGPAAFGPLTRSGQAVTKVPDPVGHLALGRQACLLVSWT